MSTAQRAEATQTDDDYTTAGMSVTWRGTVFVLPSPADFPLEALEYEEDGKPFKALRLVLGDQYPVWRTIARTAADAEDFSACVARELGRGNH